MTTCPHLRFWNEILLVLNIYFSKTIIKHVHHNQSIFLHKFKESHPRLLSISVTLAVRSQQYVTKRVDRLCTISIFSCQCLALYKGPILLKSIPILDELDFYAQLISGWESLLAGFLLFLYFYFFLCPFLSFFFFFFFSCYCSFVVLVCLLIKKIYCRFYIGLFSSNTGLFPFPFSSCR